MPPRSRMTRLTVAFSFIGVFLVTPTGSLRGQGSDTLLGRYTFPAAPGAQVVLSDELEEISGLAFSPDGRLFAHHDERAILFEIDPVTGEIIWRSALGRNGIRGDFEGLAFGNDRGFLVLSDGSLFEFDPQVGVERLEYRRVRSGFRNRCEVEGLAFEETSNTLLLACKTPRDRELQGRVAVFAFSLDTMTLEEEPRVFLSTANIPGLDGDELSPSGIEVDPETGHLIVVAARQLRIVEFSPDGDVLDQRMLDASSHRQPEGIALDADGAILIADEANGGTPTLSRYLPFRRDAP